MPRDADPSLLRPALVVLGTLIGVSIITVFLTIRSRDRGETQALHVREALRLMEDERWEEARAEFRAALLLGNDIDSVLGLAECSDRLGDSKKALQLYDRAIRSSPNWYAPYMRKARCIERNEGAAAARAFYRELEAREKDVAKYRYLLGYHHMESGRPQEALPCFHAALEIILERHGVHFDERNQLAPPGRVATMGQNDLADLWPDVTYIATCYHDSGRPQEAFRWAARGISLHQHINTRKGYCSEAQIEAGSVECRLLLARIHMEREEWSAAQRQLEHAQTFDDKFSKTRCAAFARELEERRAR